MSLKEEERDFPCGPVVKNPPSNAGDMGSISGQGTKIPHAMGQLSLCPATTEPTHSGAHVPQLESLCATARERSPRAAPREAHTPQRRSQVPQLRPDTAK